jgi:S1-C subfamily serine protease
MVRPLEAVPATASASVAATAPSVLDDRELTTRLTTELKRLGESGQGVAAAEWAAQLNRRSCRVAVGLGGAETLSPAQIASRCGDGVLVLGCLYKCPNCDNGHIKTAGCYVISSEGVAVTCYHVVDEEKALAWAAIDRRGCVFPVREVLAADPENDLAVIRLEGQEFHPLPVSTEAPQGAPVTVIGHPSNRFYTLTTGLVSRYFAKGPVTTLEVTAELAPGSSGSPVFNDRGAVVGTARSIARITHKFDGKKDDEVMILRCCAPTEALLRMIGGTSCQ